MTTRRRSAARAVADTAQLRLFAEVDAALERSASDIRAEQAAEPGRPAGPQPLLATEAPAPAERIVPAATVEHATPAPAAGGVDITDLALAHLAAQGDHNRAMFAFRRDPVTVALVKHAIDAEAATKAGYERALHAVQTADAHGDRAKAAYSRAVLGMAASAYEASREHLLAVSESHRAHVYGGSTLAAYDARMAQEQDVLDRRAALAEEARLELLDALMAEPPAYLPRLAVDASPQRRAQWEQQAVGIETYRARFGVTDETHPLGPRPVDLDGALEYERTARQLRVEGRGRMLSPELAHAVEQHPPLARRLEQSRSL